MSLCHTVQNIKLRYCTCKMECPQDIFDDIQYNEIFYINIKSGCYLVCIVIKWPSNWDDDRLPW